MFRIRLAGTGMILLSVGLVSAATAGDRSEFEKWMQQETQSFQDYKDKRDKEFTQFLKSQWKEMQTFQGLVRDKTPKPVKFPVAPQPKPEPEPEPVTPPVSKLKPKPVPEKAPVKAPETQPLITKVTPPVVKVPAIKPVPAPVTVKPAPVVKVPRGQRVDIRFYGQALQFYYDPKLKVRLSSRLDAQAMSKYWSDLSLADYEPLIQQLNAQRKPLGLNDWGYALLVNRLAGEIHPRQPNEQALLTWFVMIKAGYQARIAYDNYRVFLLLPSEQQLFGASYFTFGDVRYYALSFDGKKHKPGRVYTYDGQYQGASKRLDMRLNTAINTARKEQGKVLNFNYKGENYQLNVGYDRETVQFLNTYPQMDIGLYFPATVNQATANPLLKQLKPLVEGRSEQEAVNLLLRFVQTSFKYKTDDVQFGSENYLFPEETLYYPYSDCEDRSVLFAWLVHNLVGLDVVGLDFPGHIATAVKFSEPVKGDAVNYKGQHYVVADPTYINARAGMTMPDFRAKRPTVIPILF